MDNIGDKLTNNSWKIHPDNLSKIVQNAFKVQDRKEL